MVPLPSTITDQELWALTLKVEREHGDAAPKEIAERIGAAALINDPIGVDLWKAVAERYDRLRR